MAKFVRIQSTRPIVVTGGLQAIDMTDKTAAVPDKLNVKPTWTAFRVQLRAGTGYYPARIADWSSVKVLSAKEVLTVGQFTDTVPAEYAEEAEKTYKQLEYEYSKYEKQLAKNAGSKTNKKAAKKSEEPTLFSDDEE